MNPDFYNEFDTETVSPRSRKDFRTVFQVDRDRILYSEGFRRLQNKTQVFISGEYDFYHTRLTHSLEVAQIGRSIVNFLNHHYFREEAIDGDLVEGICLAHDLGNPAFGHAGESALNRLMKSYGGFEGNAQSLKIVTEGLHQTGNIEPGMKPSRAFLDGILKYKILWNESNKSGKFLYDEQSRYLEFVYPDGIVYQTPSLECQIMDWADDVAYALHDLADGHTAGYISQKNLYDWAVENNIDGMDEEHVNNLIVKLDHREKFQRFIATRVGQFIENVELAESEHPLAAETNRYRYRMEVHPEIIAENKLYKQIAFQIIFQSPQIQQLEFKGQYLYRRLFESFIQFGENLPIINTAILPKIMRRKISQMTQENRLSNESSGRLICDFLAEQTDNSLVRLYKRLFDPDFGSLVDIV
ncbi:MAG TPA: dNTP triphosphohydrolase [Candidatus Marinimicrobia bacterium]|nr:dNTP triphosphohydrolase [Candidatus Neomarinimicrobiota bacterium]